MLNIIGINISQQLVILDAVVAPLFLASLTKSLILETGTGNPTFVRATTATVTDFEGLIKTAKSGEARFTGARRVENLATALSAWGKSGCTAVGGQTDILGGTGAYRVTVTTGGNGFFGSITVPRAGSYRNTVYIKRVSGTGIVQIYNAAVSFARVEIGAITTTSWKRFDAGIQTVVSGGTSYYGVSLVGSTTGDVFDVCFGMKEDVTGQANQNPGEAISVGVLSAPYHGAGADGVKYFTTYNGNTVSGNVVTEATGANIPDNLLKGYLTEPASTNVVQYSENFTNWVNQGGSLVLTSGIADPKGGTGAYTLGTTTPTDALYRASDIAVIGTTYTTSIYMRRRNGTGPIYIRDVNNNVAGQLDVSSQLTSSWKRIVLPATVASGTTAWAVLLVGTVGDTVDIFGAMIEANPAPTSYIATAGATATRNADNLTYPTAGNVLNTAGTWYSEVTPQHTNPTSDTPAFGYNFIRDFGTQINILARYFGALYSYDGVTTNGTPAWSPATGGQTYKIADKWGSEKQNFLNGTAGTTSAFNVQTYGANMSIGNYGGVVGAYCWNGNIRNIKIYPKALTASKIIELQKTYLFDENGVPITDENGSQLFTY